MSAEPLEPTNAERSKFADEIVSTIEHVMLTVDELVTLSVDLELPIVLDGGLDVRRESVDAEAARRSLGSKGFVVETGSGPQLAPWLTMMADVASDPLVVIRMRRSKPDVAYEWTLFVDENLGVQQQVGDDGIIAWAPFAVGDVLAIVLDAMGIDGRELDGQPISFDTRTELLLQLDAAAQSGDVASAPAPGVLMAYITDLLLGYRSTSTLTIVDRTVEPGKVTDIAFAELGSHFWELSFLDDSTVHVSNQSGEMLTRSIVRALPIDEEAVFALAE